MKAPFLFLGLFLCVGDYAQAQKNNWIFQNDVRLRLENANSEPNERSAQVLSLRVRPSVELSIAEAIDIVAEVDGIVVLSHSAENQDSVVHSALQIPDEDTLELSRFQLSYAPSDIFRLKVGRQRIEHGDERILGSSNFRQNQQTYDALTTHFDVHAGASIEAGYIWQVNRFVPARRDEGTLDGDSYFARLNVPTSLGQLDIFLYDLDLDSKGLVAIRSDTLGLSLNGQIYREDLGLLWQIGAAQQNTSGNRSNYFQTRVSAEWTDFTAAVQFEHLGSNQDGVSFQTPLATLHKFQGGVDVFSQTPREGLQDTQAEFSWRIGSASHFRGVNAKVQFNHFQAANSDTLFGREYGLSVGGTLQDTRFSVAIASYRENGFSTDVDRVWLTISRRF